MSSPMSPEQLARMRDHARRMVKRTGEHEHDLNVLVGTAEGMVEQAAALSVAFAATDSDAGDVERLCSVHVRRSVEHAEAVRRACVRAREQHVAARRLVTRVNGEHADAHTASPRRTTAVLVVDDTQDVRDLVAHVLRDAGFVVRTAVNGLEALIAAHRPCRRRRSRQQRVTLRAPRSPPSTVTLPSLQPRRQVCPNSLSSASRC